MGVRMSMKTKENLSSAVAKCCNHQFFGTDSVLPFDGDELLAGQDSDFVRDNRRMVEGLSASCVLPYQDFASTVPAADTDVARYEAHTNAMAS